jgi:hypothetical protein
VGNVAGVLRPVRSIFSRLPIRSPDGTLAEGLECRPGNKILAQPPLPTVLAAPEIIPMIWLKMPLIWGLNILPMTKMTPTMTANIIKYSTVF